MSVRLYVGEPHTACQKHVWVVFDNKIKRKKIRNDILYKVSIFRGFLNIVTFYIDDMFLQSKIFKLR